MDSSRSHSVARRFGGRAALAALLTVAAVWLHSSVAVAQDAAEQAGQAAEAVEEGGISRESVVNIGIVVALFVVPMLVGSWLGKRLRMPDHGWKFAVAFGTIAAAAIVIWRGEIKLGPDLSGGITLIYELDSSAVEDKLAEYAEDENAVQPTYEQVERQLVEMLVTSLSKRVDPSGTKEVSIRSYGQGQLEIIIPRASQEELESIERSIYTAGALEFRIVASRVFSDHRSIIEMAEELPRGSNIVRLDDGTEVARWISYDEVEFARDESLVRREGSRGPQTLVLTNDGQDVTGDKHLRYAAVDTDKTTGKPVVAFGMNAVGSYAFGELTGNNRPTDSGQHHRLGILLDKVLLSAPNINEKITDSGTISGGSMTEKEVTDIVNILQAGSLPAALNKEPISREQISPTIGKLTIEQGKLAIGVSLLAVLIFMVLYYRFAGFVACVALAANLLLILGCMVLIKGAFTLPGLAGLVLTVGMSVDANVLIFERIREELERGAALRMAIRNGFARAMSTIIDANVTTLITGVVIYKIAPDNVKGFGVTLILGILMSVYSAIFLSRIIFDVAEKTGFLKKLSMARIVGHTHFDFLGSKGIAAAASLLLICIGIAGLVSRGGDLLNIDFTGGSSVTMVLDDAMPFADVKKTIEDDTDLDEQNLTLVEVGDSSTRYTVTSINSDVGAVEDLLGETFGDKLKTYQVDVKDVQPVSGDDQAAAPVRTSVPTWLPANPLALVTLLQDAGDEADDAPSEEATEADADEAESSAAEDAADAETEQPAESEADGGEGETAPAPEEEATADDEAADVATDDDADDAAPASAFAGGTKALLSFDLGEETDAGDDGSSDNGVNYETLETLINDALSANSATGAAYRLESPDAEFIGGSRRRFKNWEVTLALPVDQAQAVFDSLQQTINSQPMFPLASKIGSRVAGRLARDAIAAIVISLVGIIGYIWFRFNGVIYGLAAVVALVHDVTISLGIVALSAYLVDGAAPLANMLMVDKFQVSLPMVAAILTLIGYSLNDTIVVFDRIREVKGKSPRLTKEIINDSVNQTLSRTLLTSGTTLLTVLVLYILGGEGIHGFAFALIVGVIVGTYSSIYIASPALLWMSDRMHAAEEKKKSPARAA